MKFQNNYVLCWVIPGQDGGMIVLKWIESRTSCPVIPIWQVKRGLLMFLSTFEMNCSKFSNVVHQLTGIYSSLINATCDELDQRMSIIIISSTTSKPALLIYSIIAL